MRYLDFVRRHRLGGRAWIGLVGLLLALLIGASLRATPPRAAEDLRPQPDALEYEEGARNLIAGDGYSLIVNGGIYPPRYPPGFSLLLVPLLAVADQGPGTGVLVVFAGAMLTLVAAFLIARNAAGPVAGAGAALMLAVSPAHVTWSRAVMSDVPSACAVTWLLLGISAGSRHHASRRWFVLGFGMGLSSLLRLTNLAIAIPATIAALRSEKHPLKAPVALAAGVVVGLLPLLVYDLVRFGSPFRTGYDVWAPGQYFALSHAFDPPRGGGTVPNFWVYGRAVVGLGDLYPWPFAVLVALGLVRGLVARGAPRELALYVVALAVPLLGAQLIFFWQGTRFLLPALPALLCAAALPLGMPTPRWLRVVALTLLVAGLAVLATRPQLYARDRHFGEPTILAEIDELVPDDAAVVVNTSESVFRRSLRRPGTDRLWVRLALDQHQVAALLNRISPEVRPAVPPQWIQPVLRSDNAVASVGALLDAGRPVYISTLRAFKVKGYPQLVALLRTHFEFELVARTSDGGQLHRIRPRAAARRFDGGATRG